MQSKTELVYRISLFFCGLFWLVGCGGLQKGDPAKKTGVNRVIEGCIGEYWWSADSQHLYYILCDEIKEEEGRSFLWDYHDPQVLEEGAYIHKLNVITGIETPAEETVWPPRWVPKQYLAQLPTDITVYPVSVSPSGNYVLYSQLIPEPLEDGGYTMEINIIIDSQTVISFGPIPSSPVAPYPHFVTWSQDEKRIFIRSDVDMSVGYLLDINQQQWSAIHSPTPDSDDLLYDTLILPDGSGIIFYNAPYSYYKYYFDSGVLETIPYKWRHIHISSSPTLTNGVLVYKLSGDNQFYWYDLVEQKLYHLAIKNKPLGDIWWETYRDNPQLSPNRQFIAIPTLYEDEDKQNYDGHHDLIEIYSVALSHTPIPIPEVTPAPR